MALLFENVDHYEFRSRAINIEDEEDDAEDELRTEYKTIYEDGVTQKCQKLYILLGKSFANYIKLGVLRELKCQVIASVQDLSSKKKVNDIYQLSDVELKQRPKIYFTAVDGITEKNYFNWTTELLTLMTEATTEVVVLSTESASSYIGSASLSSYTSSALSSEDSHFFIRCLHTSVSAGDARYSQLDCPNIMSGLSAQVFLHCEGFKMKSSHYVVYSSLTTSASLIQQLLTSLGFSDIKMSPTSLKALETKLTQATATSYMYT